MMRIPRNLRDAALQRTMFQPRNAVASMPNLNSGILNVSANNQQYGGTADDIAKIIGTDIFKNTNGIERNINEIKTASDYDINNANSILPHNHNVRIVFNSRIFNRINLDNCLLLGITT